MFDEQNKILLRRVASGDANAFRQLYDLFANKVYTMALLYLKSPLEAQDAVQDIFIKIWNNRNKLIEIDSFPAWLHVITRNHLINALQKKIPLFTGNQYTTEPLEDKLLPGSQLDLKEMSALISQAVEKLTPRQRQVYRLSRDHGTTLSQISIDLGLSHDTVKEHMSNALKNIRSYLKEHYAEFGLILCLLPWE